MREKRPAPEWRVASSAGQFLVGQAGDVGHAETLQPEKCGDVDPKIAALSAGELRPLKSGRSVLLNKSILETVHESAKGLHKAGVMVDVTLRECEARIALQEPGPCRTTRPLIGAIMRADFKAPCRNPA